MRTFYATAIACAVALFGIQNPVCADSKIGVASVVKNQVQGRGSRPLAVGSEVFANERIKTGDAAQAQLMFLDKTVLSVGPRAEVVLDKFAYNPNRGAGQVVVNAVQGSMRFVTGAQNPNNYSIKTPVATLGIRGTIADVTVSQDSVFIGILEGAVTIYFRDGTSVRLVAGQFAIITANGVQQSGPYKGDDPNILNTGLPEYLRMDEINQLNAINARRFVLPATPGQPQLPPVIVGD